MRQSQVINLPKIYHIDIGVSCHIVVRFKKNVFMTFVIGNKSWWAFEKQAKSGSCSPAFRRRKINGFTKLTDEISSLIPGINIYNNNPWDF